MRRAMSLSYSSSESSSTDESDVSIRNILGDEEYQQALRAEQDFFQTTQQQILADRLVAQQYLDALPITPEHARFTLAAPPPSPRAMNVSYSSSESSSTEESDDSSESDSDDSDIELIENDSPPSPLATSSPILGSSPIARRNSPNPDFMGFQSMRALRSVEFLSSPRLSSLKTKKNTIQHKNLIKTPVPYDGSPCSICLDDLPTNPVACQLCKNCIGCAKCLDEWAKSGNFETNRQCPLCRFDWNSSKPKIVAMIIKETVQEDTPLNEPPASEQSTRQPKKAPQKRNADRAEVSLDTIARNTRLAKRRRRREDQESQE